MSGTREQVARAPVAWAHKVIMGGERHAIEKGQIVSGGGGPLSSSISLCVSVVLSETRAARQLSLQHQKHQRGSDIT
ncbi:hypothetical protein NC653_039566 [Populus alba x Populus x berolinensis]|uniref:Uncharacterized protein n=1 Tax=Populus alba x Populus x berolinensis TaxID=444605 RepID=A0AAD6LBH5_9ROSI|nr:hypothetical protein NC653_039566 [Populus alba x Populus x berolinensis]